MSGYARKDATPPQGIDRDQARAVMADFWGAGLVGRYVDPEPYLDRLAACVRPVEGGIILTSEERDLNRRIVVRMAGFARAGSVLEFDPDAVGKLADHLEARPVEGVVLNPEEAALAAETVSHITTAPPGFYSKGKQARARALLAHLEGT